MKTVVNGLLQGKLISVLLNEVSQLEHECATLCSAELGPWALLEGGTGSLDGDIYGNKYDI